jgi:hypothetical protein
MTAYPTPFDQLLNAENSSSTFMSYFDTENIDSISGVGQAIGSHGSTGTTTGALSGITAADKAQGAKLSQEKQNDTLEVSDKARLTMVENDVKALRKEMNDGFTNVDQRLTNLEQNFVTKAYMKEVTDHLNEHMATKTDIAELRNEMNQSINALRKDMFTKTDMKELLAKKTEEQVIDGKAP